MQNNALSLSIALALYGPHLYANAPTVVEVDVNSDGAKNNSLGYLAIFNNIDADASCQDSANCPSRRAMRALTAEEIELIAVAESDTNGYCDSNGCHVTATPPAPPPPPPPAPAPISPPAPPPPPPPTLATINVTAYSVKCQITAKANFSNTEYAAFLYNQNGNIVVGPLTSGDYISVNFTYPTGVPYGDIVGLVHSHDPTLCTSAGLTATSQQCVALEYAPSTPASSPNGTGDWGMYNSSPYNLTWGYQNGMGLYIVDPDGKLRYFPPSNKSQSAPGTVVTGTGC